MLKFVNFIILDRRAEEDARGLAFRLREDGLSAAVYTQGRAEERTEERGDVKEALYITDDVRLVHELLDQGAYAVILYTASNREEDLGGIRYALEGLKDVETDYVYKLYDRLAGNPWNILTTERCRLREITEADVDELYRIYEEPEITAYMENLFEDRQKEMEYTQAYIRNMCGFYGYGMWIVEELASGRVIGRAGIEYKEEAGGLELGYVIAKPYQRRGYAYEVCQAVLRYAHEELGFTKVSAFVDPGNTASVKLCHKLGMVREGTREAAGKALAVFRKKYGREDSALPV